MRRSEHTSIEATEGDAIASVAHVLDAPETENVAGEGSQVPSALRRSAITGRSKTGGQQELADEIRELAGRLPRPVAVWRAWVVRETRMMAPT